MAADYIDREIVKETEKAFLVEVPIYNRRDGAKLKYEWVAKSLCKPPSTEYQELIKKIPEEIRKENPELFRERVSVPTWIIGEGRW